MASKAISVGVGIPMIVAGALIAIFLPQYDVEIMDQPKRTAVQTRIIL